MTRLDTPASCLDYSPDGDLLIVGLGSRDPLPANSTTSQTSLTVDGGGDEGESGGRAEGRRRGGGGRGKRGKGGSDKSGGEKGGEGAKSGGFIVLSEADFVTTFEARDAKKVRTRSGKREFFWSGLGVTRETCFAAIGLTVFGQNSYTR